MSQPSISPHILETITDAYSNNQLIPIVGSGLSMPFGLPSWGRLLSAIAEDISLPEEENEKLEAALKNKDYLQATDILLENDSLTEDILQQKVAKLMSEAKEGKEPSLIENNYTDLAKMEYARFLTTNYDGYLNDFLGTSSIYLSQFCDGTIKSNEFSRKKYRKKVIPVHGEIGNPDSIVLSRRSYEKLYASKEFDRGFQFLRAGYTFLFLGFSFDDVYFQKLFEKIIGRFESQHYILLDRGQITSPKEQEKLDEKVFRLYQEYGVVTIYYDSSLHGHTSGIREVLEQIIKFNDSDVDLSNLKKLSPKDKSWEEEQVPDEVKNLLEQCQKAVNAEQLTLVKEISDKIYLRDDFELLPVLTRQQIYCYQIWYYSYLNDFETPQTIIHNMDEDIELKKHRGACAFMFAQALWNARRWDTAAEILNTLNGNNDKLLMFMADVISYSKEMLPDQSQEKGNIKIYGEQPWSQQKKEQGRKLYLTLKEKYVNLDTYNLLNVKEYKNAENQYIVYFWLGVMAGQVFHEHKEAVEYLNRALEIKAERKIYEELGQNYLAWAEEKIRYRTESRYYEVDKAPLLKARRCFLFAMQTDDGQLRESIYQKSGRAYLHTLFLLKRYYEYEEFYKKVEKVLPKDYNLIFQKAECDAQFFYEVPKEELDLLNEKDRLYIEAVRDYSKANFIEGQGRREESIEIRKKIVKSIEAETGDVPDERLISLLQDCLFFLGDVEGYNRHAKLWNEDMRAFGYEINGRMQDAEEAFIAEYRLHPDISTFSILNGFYLRQGEEAKSRTLYEEALSENSLFECEKLDLIKGYLINQLQPKRHIDRALDIFLRYKREFDGDHLVKQEITEILWQEIRDYSNPESRIAWNRFLMKIAPKDAKHQMFRNMFFLCVCNFKFIEAREILDEMKTTIGTVPNDLNAICDILRREQKRQRYSHQRPNFSKDYLLREADSLKNRMGFKIPCFGLEGKEIILPMSFVLQLFLQGRQKELDGFQMIYLTYEGIVGLQQSLCAAENPLLRMVLQYLQRASNIKLVSPSIEAYYNEIKNKVNWIPEKVQINAYRKEHPEVFYPIPEI